MGVGDGESTKFGPPIEGVFNRGMLLGGIIGLGPRFLFLDAASVFAQGETIVGIGYFNGKFADEAVRDLGECARVSTGLEDHFLKGEKIFPASIIGEASAQVGLAALNAYYYVPYDKIYAGEVKGRAFQKIPLESELLFVLRFPRAVRPSCKYERVQSSVYIADKDFDFDKIDEYEPVGEGCFDGIVDPMWLRAHKNNY